MPRGVHGGIAGSGAPGRLDPESQEILCRFHLRASIGGCRETASLIGQAAAAAGRVKRENAPDCAPV